MSDLTERLVRAQIAGCNCFTKSPDIQYHSDLCHYRLHSEAEAELDRLRDENRRLSEALRPFVEYVNDDFRERPGRYVLTPTAGHGGGWIGAEDLRFAKMVWDGLGQVWPASARDG